MQRPLWRSLVLRSFWRQLQRPFRRRRRTLLLRRRSLLLRRRPLLLRRRWPLLLRRRWPLLLRRRPLLLPWSIGDSLGRRRRGQSAWSGPGISRWRRRRRRPLGRGRPFTRRRRDRVGEFLDGRLEFGRRSERSLVPVPLVVRQQVVGRPDHNLVVDAELVRGIVQVVSNWSDLLRSRRRIRLPLRPLRGWRRRRRSTRPLRLEWRAGSPLRRWRWGRPPSWRGWRPIRTRRRGRARLPRTGRPLAGRGSLLILLGWIVDHAVVPHRFW